MLNACSSIPKTTEIWMDEAYDGKQYGKILVIGAAEKITFRNLFEGEHPHMTSKSFFFRQISMM